MYDVLISIKYIVEDRYCIVPDFKNVENMQKGRQREAWGIKDTNNGGNIVQVLAEDD